MWKKTSTIFNVFPCCQAPALFLGLKTTPTPPEIERLPGHRQKDGPSHGGEGGIEGFVETSHQLRW